MLALVAGCGGELRGGCAYKSVAHVDYWQRGWDAVDEALKGKEREAQEREVAEEQGKAAAEDGRKSAEDRRKRLELNRDRRDELRLRAEAVIALFGVLSVLGLFWQIQQQEKQVERQAQQFQQQAAQQLAQIRQQARQIKAQEADTRIVRRVQLLETIYAEECEDPADQETCRPRAGKRVREAAVRALAQIQHSRGEHLDLAGANLRGLRLQGAAPKALASGTFYVPRRTPFVGANLNVADLRWTQLMNTDLRGASAAFSNFQSANLAYTVLLNTALSGANLQHAILWDADLRHADLSGADLRGIAVSDGTNFSDTLADENTITSPDFPRPDHWPEMDLRDWRLTATNESLHKSWLHLRVAALEYRGSF